VLRQGDAKEFAGNGWGVAKLGQKGNGRVKEAVAGRPEAELKRVGRGWIEKKSLRITADVGLGPPARGIQARKRAKGGAKTRAKEKR